LVVCAVASSITSGKPFPDGTRSRKGKVGILCNPEDSFDTDWLPRLIAAGANPANVDGRHNMNFKNLSKYITSMGAGVEAIFIDPIVGMMGGAFMHDLGARKMMDRLNAISRQHDIAIIGLVHTNKQGQMSGSKTVLNIGRTAYEVCPFDNRNSILKNSKANHGPAHRGLKFRITPTMVQGIPTVYAKFERRWFEMDRDDQLGGGRITEAIEFLLLELNGRALPVRVIKEQARDAGLSWRTIERAKGRLRIKAECVAQRMWFWSMPGFSVTEEIAKEMQEEAEARKEAEQAEEESKSATAKDNHDSTKTPQTLESAMLHGGGLGDFGGLGRLDKTNVVELRPKAAEVDEDEC
jgi:hypothetical protein